jgi:hippurate hydrolase
VKKAARAAVERNIRKECEVSGSTRAPRIETAVSSSAIENDDIATARFTSTVQAHYGKRAAEVVWK